MDGKDMGNQPLQDFPPGASHVTHAGINLGFYPCVLVPVPSVCTGRRDNGEMPRMI